MEAILFTLRRDPGLLSWLYEAVWVRIPTTAWFAVILLEILVLSAVRGVQ